MLQEHKQKNPLTQFELHTFDYNPQVISDAYDWCLANLRLKDEHGLMYRVNELFIVTRSQQIIDKVNRHFGTMFSFSSGSDKIYFISRKKE